MDAIRDYLLDNNIISILARQSDARYAAVRAKVEAISGKIWLPVVAIAEIRFGLAKSSLPNHPERAELEAFLAQYPLRARFDEHTIEPYAEIRAQLWRDYGTPKAKQRGHKEKLTEELVDRATGICLGIDERDLMIASSAAQFGLVLATNDSGGSMRRIEEAAQRLEQDGKPVRLRVDYWP